MVWLRLSSRPRPPLFDGPPGFFELKARGHVDHGAYPRTNEHGSAAFEAMLQPRSEFVASSVHVVKQLRSSFLWALCCEERVPKTSPKTACLFVSLRSRTPNPAPTLHRTLGLCIKHCNYAREKIAEARTAKPARTRAFLKIGIQSH